MHFLRYIPNLLTLMRLLISASLLFISPFTQLFFALYTISGISDVLDGFIARKARITSDIGAQLDSIADLTLYAVTLFKIFPKIVVVLESPIWYWVGLIIAIRIASYLLSAFKHKRFSALHTYLNKATGFVVFLTPYAYYTSYFNAFCIFICIIATLSSVEELIIHFKASVYPKSQKTLIK